MLRLAALRALHRQSRALARGVADFSSRIAADVSITKSAGVWGFAAVAVAAAGGTAALAWAGVLPLPAQVVLHAEAKAASREDSGAQEFKPDSYKLPATGLKGLPKEVIIYQYEVCPFCCKVKAFLDFYKIPYRCVEVNPLTKGELKWSEYKKVPVVVLDGEQVNDSSAIISRLEAELEAEGRSSSQRGGGGSGSGGGGGGGGLFGRRPRAQPPVSDRGEEEQWRRWVDERLVRVITVNIYRNAHEAFQTFDYITEHGNFNWVNRQAARYVGATLMWAIAGRLKKKYGVEGDSRENLYLAANDWVTGLKGRRFMGGSQPNLADLATFGVIRAVTGTDTFNDLMHNTEIGPWYERMFEAVGSSSRIDAPENSR